jgi:hypothetical protein
MQMVIGGDATAVGDNTVAVGSVAADVSASELIDTASGTATFSAVGESVGSQTSYATAYSFAAVSGGQTTVTMNYTSTQLYETEIKSTWSQQSTTQVFAMDIDNPGSTADDTLDLSAEPAADPEGWSQDDAEAPEFEFELSPEADDSFDINGNVAYFNVEAEATGEHTFLSLDALALTVEGQLSTVSLVVVAEAG